ncbi:MULTISPECIES: hypothetical protein [Streptomyces]|uniref:hypothetical protein n=1 Tax=Streptomyces TaxID=1883 RepID=UPI00225C23F2|nr:MULTISPECIES: hypothetical protein [Streptomyces]MCX4430297.1 hypothetical protein [Streptomyces mirabilis]
MLTIVIIAVIVIAAVSFKQHGSLDEQPLSPEDRAQYAAQWRSGPTSRNSSSTRRRRPSPADTLLAGLARDRGFPDGERFEEQLATLSVHHAAHIHGYRSVHTAARGQSVTEEMREA